MGHFKEIFKILLVLQLLSHALAYGHGHPDAEVIDFGTDPSRDQSIIEAAIKRGMDGDSVAELLRTKQPVVKVVTTPDGATKTTTYKLNDDGSISSRTITTTTRRVVYNSDSIPDDLNNSPSGTVTRTYIDENGHKVTQTTTVGKPKPSTTLDTDDLSGDWFSKPIPSWKQDSPFPSSHQTFTRTFTGPNHRTVTRTFTGPNGERRVTQTASSGPDDTEFTNPKQPTFSSPNSGNWPGFDFPAFSPPWGSSDSEDDWTVLDENPKDETTTKNRFETWTPKTWNWPEFPITTTTAKPKIYIEPEIATRKPLPSLDEFLKSQYGSTTTSKTPTTTTVKASTTPRTPTTTNKSNTATTTKKLIHVNIDDLPISEVFYNGKPVDEDMLEKLPRHLKPKLNTENVYKIENIQPVDKGVDIFTPKKVTNTYTTRTLTNTLSGSQRPNIEDLDPQMQETLRKAGISPEDIANSNGDTITKTRTEPDGRRITTTYKIKTTPPKETTPIVNPQPYNPYRPIQMPPMTPFGPVSLSPISEFLAKLGLTKFDVSSQNGRLTKTFIDENGDVLTATFVLGSSMSKRSIPEMNSKPFK